MKKTERFVIWICSKFNRIEIEEIIKGLLDVLSNRNPEVKPRDDFKEKHPNYRNFYVDPNPPLPVEEKSLPELNWKELLSKYKKEHGKPLKPVNCKKEQSKVFDTSTCRICGAPSKYLYFNDGKRRQQIRCKVCSSLTQVHPRDRETRKAKYACPYCTHNLFLWKENKDVSIYKCCNDNCPHYLANKSKLNLMERILIKIKSSQFKLCYQFREYHFTNEQLKVSCPAKKVCPLFFNIRNPLNTLCLALTFRISCGLSSRKTAFVLNKVFSIPISHKTVDNYCEYASYHCHLFNRTHKEETYSIQVGDEAYIKILGEDAFPFFFISPKRHSITSYHIGNDRGTLPATISMKEALSNAFPGQEVTFITDGNPSYAAAIHFLNQKYSYKLIHKKVIGLQNLDKESEEYRTFKQLIERFMRTYRFHTRPSCGFNSFNGAVSITVLTVTHYNFLRPHIGLSYEVPIPLKEIQDIPTLQGQWAKILQMATANTLPA